MEDAGVSHQRARALQHVERLARSLHGVDRQHLAAACARPRHALERRDLRIARLGAIAAEVEADFPDEALVLRQPLEQRHVLRAQAAVGDPPRVQAQPHTHVAERLQQPARPLVALRRHRRRERAYAELGQHLGSRPRVGIEVQVAVQIEQRAG